MAVPLTRIPPGGSQSLWSDLIVSRGWQTLPISNPFFGCLNDKRHSRQELPLDCHRWLFFDQKLFSSDSLRRRHRERTAGSRSSCSACVRKSAVRACGPVVAKWNAYNKYLINPLLVVQRMWNGRVVARNQNEEKNSFRRGLWATGR